MKREFTPDEAYEIGDKLGIHWAGGDIDLEEFRIGLAIELEHGKVDPQTNVAGDGLFIAGKAALAHLKDIPDYYTRLARMEAEAGIDPPAE